MQNLKPQLSTLAPRLGYAGGDEQQRNQYRYGAEPWRVWYGSARWKRLRWRVWVRDLFTCQLCHRITRKGEAVADHKAPHRGNARLFWDEANLQCVCKGCHDSVKQAAERGMGWPRGRGA
jgi:5-methylcytosine-specific restriction endonuclease McrA